MDNKLQIFKYTDKEVRTVTKDGEPWFVAKDVCEVLAHSNSRKAIQDHCDSEDVTKSYIGVNTGLGKQNIEVNLVNESGVYSLVFGSILPEAKQFKRWITHEVLPAIRRTGSYNMQNQYIEAAKTLAKTPSTRLIPVISAYHAAGLTEIIMPSSKPQKIIESKKEYVSKRFMEYLLDYISDPSRIYQEKYIIGQPFRNYIKAVYGENLTPKQFGDLMRAAGSNIKKINIYNKNDRTTRSVWRLPL